MQTPFANRAIKNSKWIILLIFFIVLKIKKHQKIVDISVVVPIWKDREHVSHFVKSVELFLQNAAQSHEIIFCVVSSSDGFKSAVKDLCNKNQKIKAISFSSRAGQSENSLS